MTKSKHENYEILNLIGYGLAKFDMSFVREFNFKTKTEFYKSIVHKNIADTVGTVKNRQDLFDPFFDNKRKGWWQKGDAYIHRKILIDSLYGELNVNDFADVVKLYISEKYQADKDNVKNISPILKSKFRQLQETGNEAELYFINNFNKIGQFQNGILEDARLFGDGYDFQIEVSNQFFLAEIKGVRTCYGSLRFTKNECQKAKEFKKDYGLIVISNLADIPKMTSIFDPVSNLDLTKQTVISEQITYHTNSIEW